MSKNKIKPNTHPFFINPISPEYFYKIEDFS